MKYVCKKCGWTAEGYKPSECPVCGETEFKEEKEFAETNVDMIFRFLDN